MIIMIYEMIINTNLCWVDAYGFAGGREGVRPSSVFFAFESCSATAKS